MAKEYASLPARKKFRMLAGAGGACIAAGLLISFTVIGLPLGIPLVIAGGILLLVSPVYKAKHLVRRQEDRGDDRSRG